jgi:hypothetical protein
MTAQPAKGIVKALPELVPIALPRHEMQDLRRIEYRFETAN